MTELAIGRLAGQDESAWFILKGAGQIQGLIGTDYELNPNLTELVEEQLCLNLRGSRAQLNRIFEHLERYCGTAEGLGFNPLVLRIWSHEQNRYLFSKIEGARLELSRGEPISMQAGSMRLIMRIWRQGSFFSEEETLPLANTSGSGITTGITLLNHDDDQLGHDNWFTVDTASLGLSQPASLRFELENDFNGSALSHFWLAGWASRLPETKPKLNLEAESALGGTVISSALASAGKYCQYRWLGGTWSNLATWTLGAVEVSQFAGRCLTPILRLFTALTEDQMQFRLLISQAGKTVWQSPESRGESGKAYLSLDPINLPLGSLPLTNYAYPHQLVLQARHPAVTEHLLELDDLLLLPHEPFSVFHDLSGLSSQSRIVDDGLLDYSWSLRNGQELKTHRRLGDKLLLQPGQKQHFWVFQTDEIGKAPIERSLKVRAWIRRHWSLP